MKEFISVLFLFLSVSLIAQDRGFVSGKISDSKSGQSMIAVNVGVDGKGGAISDSEGNYQVIVSPGQHKISFSFVGYETFFETVSVDAGKSVELNVEMEVSTSILDEVVVSAGRYEQKLSDVTVSMEVLKA
ncbi:MAG: carboxypeptidase-like regulatory domain-containing protein, partial [Bacteroidales bacterium]|nr:carboxypeptidase-like regulatory domain-containing protein [Bacteroidales bacterium]